MTATISGWAMMISARRDPPAEKLAAAWRFDFNAAADGNRTPAVSNSDDDGKSSNSLDRLTGGGGSFLRRRRDLHDLGHGSGVGRGRLGFLLRGVFCRRSRGRGDRKHLATSVALHPLAHQRRLEGEALATFRTQNRLGHGGFLNHVPARQRPPKSMTAIIPTGGLLCKGALPKLRARLIPQAILQKNVLTGGRMLCLSWEGVPG